MRTLAQLLIQETKTTIYERALALATTLGVPTTSWEAGNPTRSLYYLLGEELESLVQRAAFFAASGFLELASGDWLRLRAYDVYGYSPREATYATTQVTLTNNGGALYDGLEAGDITFRSAISGKTYHNTSGGNLASWPGTGAHPTLTVDVEADEPGADSSADPGDISEMVTVLNGVTCSNATAAVGQDEESEASIRAGCRAKLGPMSATGPRDAYVSVALNSTLTGTTAITRARAQGDSTSGHVTVYVAGPSGAVAEEDRAKVQTAILTWATPLCITPAVLSAGSYSIAVTYSLWLYSSIGMTEDAVKARVADALTAMLADRPIGGDVISGTQGYVYQSMIASTIREAFPDHAFRVEVSSPAGDTALSVGQVPALGTPTGTIVFVRDP